MFSDLSQLEHILLVSSGNYLSHNCLVILLYPIFDSLILRMPNLMLTQGNPMWIYGSFSLFNILLSGPLPHQFQPPQSLQTLICLLNLAWSLYCTWNSTHNLENVSKQNFGAIIGIFFLRELLCIVQYLKMFVLFFLFFLFSVSSPLWEGKSCAVTPLWLEAQVLFLYIIVFHQFCNV